MQRVKSINPLSFHKGGYIRLQAYRTQVKDNATGTRFTNSLISANLSVFQVLRVLVDPPLWA